jgi:hypothetical protein
MAVQPFANMATSFTESGGSGLLMASRHDIESAKHSMLEARKALEDDEALKGFASTCDHLRLNRVFTKATKTYLRLSAGQR